MKRLRPREHAASVTERDEVRREAARAHRSRTIIGCAFFYRRDAVGGVFGNRSLPRVVCYNTLKNMWMDVCRCSSFACTTTPHFSEELSAFDFANQQPPFFSSQVMAKNLMKLEGNTTTVAVVGFGHLDGIENMLGAGGWKPVRS